MANKTGLGLDDLARLMDERLAEANTEIRNLLKRVTELEKHVEQQDLRIKSLESKTVDASAASGIVGSDHHVVVESKQNEIPAETADQTTEVRPTSSNISTSSAECHRSKPDAKAIKDFGDWMNTTKRSRSIWVRPEYRDPLLNYIGKIFGQDKKAIDRLSSSLNIETNPMPDLDQLNRVIQLFEQQPGAKEALRKYEKEKRPTKRSAELRLLFRLPADDAPVHGGGLSLPWESKQQGKIDATLIKDYFDLICRDGVVTAAVGSIFHLEKQHIFGGDVEDRCSEHATYTKIRLNGRSMINLGDTQVDLITCLVTLHHVPHLESMLQELARILRPGGYLIVREHDCKKERSIRMKYLNFVYGFMMIAGVGEFGRREGAEAQGDSTKMDWAQQRQAVIEYTHSIEYRSREEWRKELAKVGFVLTDEMAYRTGGNHKNNPLSLYYDIFQLKKPM